MLSARGYLGLADTAFSAMSQEKAVSVQNMIEDFVVDCQMIDYEYQELHDFTQIFGEERAFRSLDK